MKTRKKSDVGLAEASTQLNGESKKENNGLNVKTVKFYLLLKTNQYPNLISLFGLKNGLLDAVLWNN
jgi:predicted NAD/FAD-binding protein